MKGALWERQPAQTFDIDFTHLRDQLALFVYLFGTPESPLPLNPGQGSDSPGSNNNNEWPTQKPGILDQPPPLPPSPLQSVEGAND